MSVSSAVDQTPPLPQSSHLLPFYHHDQDYKLFTQAACVCACKRTDGVGSGGRSTRAGSKSSWNRSCVTYLYRHPHAHTGGCLSTSGSKLGKGWGGEG